MSAAHSRLGRLRPRGPLAALIALAVLAACSGELTSPTEPLRLLGTSLPNVYVGESVDLPLRPTGGLRPYTFAVVDGALPPGLSTQGGRILGTPTAEGRFAFTIEISDANLNRTVQRFELLVRPLPVPVLRIDAPTTDVQRPAPLRLRVEDARGWRGAKVEITWDADAFSLDPESVAAARDDVAPVWESEPGRLRVDVAMLGGALDGGRDLLRFTLVPDEAGPLGLTVTGEHRFAGGHHHASRREGSVTPATPRPAPAAPHDEAPATEPDAPGVDTKPTVDPELAPDPHPPAEDDDEDEGA